MATVIDSLDITGLRVTHFEQLREYLLHREIDEWYYGRRDQFEKRHKNLKQWLDSNIAQLKSEGVIVPDKRSTK